MPSKMKECICIGCREDAFGHEVTYYACEKCKRWGTTDEFQEDRTLEVCDECHERVQKALFAERNGCMKKFILVFVILFLSGCGKGTIESARDHGVFEPYFQKFETESLKAGRNTTGDNGIPISFGNPGDADGNTGYCFQGLNDFYIVVDQTQWQALDEPTRTMLIAHELGHCLLHRVHDASTIPDSQFGKILKTIMNAGLVPADVFQNRESYYWTELFQPQN